MFANFWIAFLYQPLFNFLIWIYNNWTNTNMGWAIVYMTIVLRMLLLPFSLMTEKDRIQNETLIKDVDRLNETYKNDPILKKEEIRRVLKRRRVRPWAKVIVIGIQLLVLVLLYQVFLRGITGERMLKFLYPSVDFPGAINTNFYGFQLGRRHDLIWSGAAAIFLLLEIYFEYRRERHSLSQSDLLYFLAFPAFVFAILWWLPMVKSLFVLTSLAFSAIIYQFSKLLFREKKPKTAAASH